MTVGKGGYPAVFDRRLFLFLALLLILPGAQQASATTKAGAVQHIQLLGEQAFGVLQRGDMSLEQREAILADILSRGFDLPLIARFVLGRYWRRVTPEQRDSYVELFGQFVIKTYSRHLGGFMGSSFHIVGAEPIGKSDILVRTILRRKSGPPFEANWRVRLIGDKHKILDVIVEGISMAVTQRQEFAAVLKRDGVERLLQILSAKVGRMPAAS
ncbi:MAG: ABC transporter substrate-binding protein [Hyphomicrobium sp.]